MRAVLKACHRRLPKWWASLKIVIKNCRSEGRLESLSSKTAEVTGVLKDVFCVFSVPSLQQSFSSALFLCSLRSQPSLHPALMAALQHSHHSTHLWWQSLLSASCRSWNFSSLWGRAPGASAFSPQAGTVSSPHVLPRSVLLSLGARQPRGPRESQERVHRTWSPGGTCYTSRFMHLLYTCIDTLDRRDGLRKCKCQGTTYPRVTPYHRLLLWYAAALKPFRCVGGAIHAWDMLRARDGDALNPKP